MKHYEAQTVGGLIETLKTMDPSATVEGLSANSGSYRGYYSQVAIRPGIGVSVAELLKELLGKVGKEMTGYKGGVYTYDNDCYVFIAPYGDLGGLLGGFIARGTKLEPVTFEHPFVW